MRSIGESCLNLHKFFFIFRAGGVFRQFGQWDLSSKTKKILGQFGKCFMKCDCDKKSYFGWNEFAHVDATVLRNISVVCDRNFHPDYIWKFLPSVPFVFEDFTNILENKIFSHLNVIYFFCI